MIFIAALCSLPALGMTAPGMLDDEGQALELATPARRVVSLSPGATAMLFAAGASTQIVGTADFSDEPEAARSIPRVGDSQGFDLEKILALHPDVVVVWSGGTSAAQVERLRRGGLRLYRHRVQRLEDFPGAIARMGRLLGTVDHADATARGLQSRIDALSTLATPTAAQPRMRQVLLQVWDRPVYTVGGSQLMSDALAHCGFRNLYADLHDAAPAVTVESVLRRNPEVIVAIAPDPSQATEWLQRWNAFAGIAAVQSHRLLGLTDQRFTRMGPSVVDATEALCSRLRALP